MLERTYKFEFCRILMCMLHAAVVIDRVFMNNRVQNRGIYKCILLARSLLK